MKTPCYLYSLVAVVMSVVLASCTHDSPDGAILSRAAALVESGQHTEALTALDSIDEKTLNECDRAHLHFLKGVSLDEYTKLNEAVTLLRRSLHESKACADDSIAHKANLYLAYLNNISGNHTLAVDHAMAALEIARRHKNHSWEGAAYLQLSGSYHAKGMIDSSRYYLGCLIPILDYQRRQDLPDMLNNIAVSFLDDNDLTQARQYLTRSLRLRSNEHTYYLMAISYQREGRPDSAEMMWNKALSAEDPYLKARISQAYAEWLNETGKYEQAATMMTRAQVLRDSIASQGMGEIAMSAQSATEQEAAEERHRRSSLWYITISAGLLVVIGALWWCLRWKSRRARKLSVSASLLSSQMEDMEAVMERLRGEIEVLRGQCERHDRDARQLEKMVNDKSRQLRLLEQKHAVKEREMKKLSTQMQKIESHHDDVMTTGRERYAQLMGGEKATQWSKNDMMLFVEYYHLMHPDFAIMIQEQYESLSPTLSMIMILSDMGYDPTRSRETLGMSDGAWRTARSRINTSRK